MNAPGARRRVLLVEDNPGDVYLIKMALAEHHLDCELVEATDGRSALSMIRGGLSGVPDLAILDLNLPFHSGREVLQAIRSDPAWSNVPVLIFTSSSSPTDRFDLGALGATIFLQKPSNLDDFLAVGARVRHLMAPTAPPSRST